MFELDLFASDPYNLWAIVMNSIGCKALNEQLFVKFGLLDKTGISQKRILTHTFSSGGKRTSAECMSHSERAPLIVFAYAVYESGLKKR